VTATTPAVPKLTPNGRSFECLPIGTVGRSAASQPAGSFDVCSANHALLATRDSGQSLYKNVSAAGGGRALEVLTPIYRSNLLPKSDAGRRAAFAGWVREVLAPTVLLAQSMSGLPEGAARLRHRAHGGDDVYTYGTPPSAPLITGLLASVLAGALVLGLRRPGPDAAPVVVAPVAAPAPREDLYDVLTGLPNRGLALDRAERMLA